MLTALPTKPVTQTKCRDYCWGYKLVIELQVRTKHGPTS